MSDIEHDTTVVSERNARKAAYVYGYEKGVEGEELPEPHDISAFHEGAHYINTVLPNLRTMAGFKRREGPLNDEDRPVVLVPDGRNDEPVIGGEDMMASDVLHDLVLDAFDRGMRAKQDGKASEYNTGGEK
jgi:hypothetical protein